MFQVKENKCDVVIVSDRKKKVAPPPPPVLKSASSVTHLQNPSPVVASQASIGKFFPKTTNNETVRQKVRHFTENLFETKDKRYSKPLMLGQIYAKDDVIPKRFLSETHQAWGGDFIAKLDKIVAKKKEFI